MSTAKNIQIMERKRGKWYLTFTLSGSNFYILLSKSDMKKLSKEIKRVGF